MTKMPRNESRIVLLGPHFYCMCTMGRKTVLLLGERHDVCMKTARTRARRVHPDDFACNMLEFITELRPSSSRDVDVFMEFSLPSLGSRMQRVAQNIESRCRENTGDPCERPVCQPDCMDERKWTNGNLNWLESALVGCVYQEIGAPDGVCQLAPGVHVHSVDAREGDAKDKNFLPVSFMDSASDALLRSLTAYLLNGTVRTLQRFDLSPHDWRLLMQAREEVDDLQRVHPRIAAKMVMFVANFVKAEPEAHVFQSMLMDVYTLARVLMSVEADANTAGNTAIVYTGVAHSLRYMQMFKDTLGWDTESFDEGPNILQLSHRVMGRLRKHTGPLLNYLRQTDVISASE